MKRFLFIIFGISLILFLIKLSVTISFISEEELEEDEIESNTNL
ncbi:hypothetical protein [Staphylococcus sp. ACRSN]|nr:hypothetical protein [Staphylococcus sp. ACRSN]